MKHPRTHVTDHALLRYFERVLGLDIEAQRRQVGLMVDRAAQAGACGVIIDGHVYKIADGAVITVRPTGSANIRAGHKPRRPGGP